MYTPNFSSDAGAQRQAKWVMKRVDFAVAFVQK
jgi:hypothetical protein